MLNGWGVFHVHRLVEVQELVGHNILDRGKGLPGKPENG